MQWKYCNHKNYFSELEQAIVQFRWPLVNALPLPDDRQAVRFEPLQK